VAFLLLHSPLLAAAATWGDLPTRLGESTLVPDVTGDDKPPFADRYIDDMLSQVTAEPDPGPLTVVAHSGAGPLTAGACVALSAARRPVDGVVFLDAGLPMARATRLELLAAENADVAAELAALLQAGGRFPDWTADLLEGRVPDPDVVIAGMRPRGIEFFIEPLPAAQLPPRLPGGYVLLSPTYQTDAQQAALAGWPVARTGLGHFAALTHPDTVASLIRQVGRGPH
jgi:hypothetical protein